MLPVNPYIAGNPVGTTDAFIGRADVLRAVRRVLRQPQQNAIVLYGQRRIGKTSVLQYLARQLSEEGLYRPVYFDLQDKATWPLEKVLGELARTIAHTLGETNPDLGTKPQTNFQKTWLPDILGQLQADTSLVLLFDEFDVLADPQANQAAGSFFPYLRELLSQAPAQLQFVFVIGRNITDLSSISLSLFKGIHSQRVSLLSKKDTTALARLSEANQTLNWDKTAVERVWELTHGHPFLAQQLCSHVWEQAYESDPEKTPIAVSADVDAIVSEALDVSRNTLEWLWDGLPPAERVVISALAEAGEGPITQARLEEVLHDSGVRVVIRELQNAPKLLQDWDLIEPVDGGYCFRVELLRRWLVEYKPLNRVQDELDRIGPAADNLYEAAYNLYLGGSLEQATDLLRQSIGLNPNHLRANELLAEILISQEEYTEAQTILESLYEYHPVAARQRLAQTYLAQVKIAAEEDEQLGFYEQVLSLFPDHPEALNSKREIWRQRGDAAQKAGNLDVALDAYQQAGMSDRVAKIDIEIRGELLQAGLDEINDREAGHDYQKAFELAQQLRKTYPKARDWEPDLARLEQKKQLESIYQRGLAALQSGDTGPAQKLLAQVVAIEPTYEQAARYLYQAVSGDDIDVLHDYKSQESQNRQIDETQVRNLRADIKVQHSKISRLENSRWVFIIWGITGSLLAVLFFALWLNSTFGSDTSIAQATFTFIPETVTNTISALDAISQMATETELAATEIALLTSTPQPQTSPKDGMTMLYVPAGEFLMGSTTDDSSAYNDEFDQHTVTLDAFWIDQTEVTNAMYALCVTDGDCDPQNAGSSFSRGSYYDAEDFADYPVIYVSWHDAQGYCQWADRRLPTEAEWEKAARGENGRIYPWGDESPSNSLLNYTRNEGDTTQAGSYSEGASPYGARDMAGNVWEWVSTLYQDYPYDATDGREDLDASGSRVLRGGSWVNYSRSVRAANRYDYAPDSFNFSVGFRCARSP